jgi:hypothetical protein
MNKFIKKFLLSSLVNVPTRGGEFFVYLVLKVSEKPRGKAAGNILKPLNPLYLLYAELQKMFNTKIN